jgi:Holliday junction resolvase RusA-like endonuclease
MAMSGGFGSPPVAIVYTDERTRNYESQLRYAGQQVMADRPPITEPVTVEIEARFQIPVSFSKRKKAEAKMGLIWPAKRPDVENIAKLMDGLNGVVWKDDRQIVVETIRKVYAENPGLTIIVETIPIDADGLVEAGLRRAMLRPLQPPQMSAQKVTALFD